MTSTYKISRFHRESHLRSQIITQTNPIIVHFGDKMALIKDGVHTEAPSFSPRYHALKAVAHVPLALYVMVVAGLPLFQHRGGKRCP